MQNRSEAIGSNGSGPLLGGRTVNGIFHDLGNTLGAVLFNLEVAVDSKCEATMLREAASAALNEARKIKAALTDLRLLFAAERKAE